MSFAIGVSVVLGLLAFAAFWTWAEWVWSVVPMKEGAIVLGYVLGVGVCSSAGAHALWVVLVFALFVTARHFWPKPEVTP